MTFDEILELERTKAALANGRELSPTSLAGTLRSFEACLAEIDRAEWIAAPASAPGLDGLRNAA